LTGDVCEVHHRRPLAEASGPVTTRIEDLAILCANCHRAIHQTRPLLSVEDFRDRFVPTRH
jgi:5-methylcytosine-specific restriction protein A